MTIEDLENLCVSSSHPYLVEIPSTDDSTEKRFIPRWFQSDVQYIGIFGNADTLDSTHWLSLFSSNDKDDPANVSFLKNRVWLPSQATCEGIITHLEYTFLWTHVGRQDSPQAKIIG